MIVERFMFLYSESDLRKVFLYEDRPEQILIGVKYHVCSRLCLPFEYYSLDFLGQQRVEKSWFPSFQNIQKC